MLAAIDVVFAMALQALLDVIRSGLYRQWVLAERALVLRVGHALRRACTQGCARRAEVDMWVVTSSLCARKSSFSL